MKNYYISKHRQYELYHFCQQYSGWIKSLSALTQLKDTDDPTGDTAVAIKHYKDRIAMINEAAEKADPLLKNYIIKGITENRSYNNLLMAYDIPCSKNTYYDRYKKFFWYLSVIRE